MIIHVYNICSGLNGVILLLSVDDLLQLRLGIGSPLLLGFDGDIILLFYQLCVFLIVGDMMLLFY